PNRSLRDRATKSLVRLLAERPQLIESLFQGFANINDLYLVERLYAVIYGAICNIGNDTVITQVSRLVFDKIFADGRPVPHILLRDYARGILELALVKGVLPEGVSPELFRPPYS